MIEKETGYVLTMGQGDVGQLGLGEDVLERRKPALAKGLEDVEILQVECGGMHTVALSNKGEVSDLVSEWTGYPQGIESAGGIRAPKPCCP